MKVLLLSVRVIFYISANIWQSYKQERGCLMYFARLANTLITTHLPPGHVPQDIHCVRTSRGSVGDS